jgi:hypothetical protein
MGEETARLIDAACKILATVGLVFGGGWTLITFLIGRKDQARTEEIEAKKPFNEKRMERYISAVNAAATIAANPNPVFREQAQAEFWTLYWGDLALFEDARVEAAMVEFGRRLKAGLGDDLKGCALTLAHACRDSLAESWSIDLSKSSVALKLKAQ